MFNSIKPFERLRRYITLSLVATTLTPMISFASENNDANQTGRVDSTQAQNEEPYTNKDDSSTNPQTNQSDTYNESSENLEVDKTLEDQNSTEVKIDQEQLETTDEKTPEEESVKDSIVEENPIVNESIESGDANHDIVDSKEEEVDFNKEDVFSLEENRKRAMEIMEQDLQQKAAPRTRFFSMRSLSRVDQFILNFAPYAQKHALANGLYPSVMLAQAALESGWNTSSLSNPPHHQLFGIKTGGSFSGEYITVPTQEWEVDPTHPQGGYYKTILDTFRVYPSYDNAFIDQAAFLNMYSRYTNVFMNKAETYRDATMALQNAGYATDPFYAQKLNNIISAYNLNRFDPQPSIQYQSHIESYGTMKVQADGNYTGSPGEGKRMEAVSIKLSNYPHMGVEYATQLQGRGWTGWSRDGEWSGTFGERRRLEAIKIRLTGFKSSHYDIYYRVHVENDGWLDWAKNGETAGTKGYGYRIEALEIQLVPKISYSAYLPTSKNELDPWQGEVTHGQVSGTVGKAQPIGNYKLNLENSHLSGTVQFISHIKGRASDNWLNWQNSGQVSGLYKQISSDKNVTIYEIDAMRMRLTGELAEKFDLYYRVHVQKLGWLDWQKNGEVAGKLGENLRIEAFEVRMQPKEHGVNGTFKTPFKEKIGPNISYKTHVQTHGWQKWVGDGALAGTTGEAKRLEALQLKLENLDQSGGVRYKTHVQKDGWHDWKSDGDIAGTVAQAKRVEAVQIELTGDIAQHYDVYYRVHAEKIGWMGWAKNGAPSGTEGMARRLEAIEVQLVRKGDNAPGLTSKQFLK